MNVVLAMRQAHIRLALELVLSEQPGVRIVGTASEAEGALALARSAQPDLVLLEWGLPGQPTPAVLDAARALLHRVRFLVLGGDPALRQPALQAGACAFVLVGDPPEQLLAALRQAQVASYW